jgi:hypothetical protein
MRSMAVYSARFMQPNTTASSSTGHHCGQVIRRSGGRATGSSTAAATTCRTATTPAGPMAPNAWAPDAAPIWLLSALPSMIAIPRSWGRSRPSSLDTWPSISTTAT